MRALGPQQLATLVALESGQPLAPALAAVAHQGVDTALVAARDGRLEDALRLLGFAPDVARAASLWPAALRAIATRVRRLPAAGSLRVELYEALHWLLPVALVQVVLDLVVRMKVLPVVAKVVSSGSSAVALSSHGTALHALAMVAGLACAGVAAASLAGRPGVAWSRWLDRARGAAILAGLLAGGAPEEVLAAPRSMARDLGGATEVSDLDLLAQDAAARAEAGMRRAAVLVRVLGVTALALHAAGLSLEVYGALSVAPGVFAP